MPPYSTVCLAHSGGSLYRWDGKSGVAPPYPAAGPPSPLRLPSLLEAWLPLASVPTLWPGTSAAAAADDDDVADSAAGDGTSTGLHGGRQFQKGEGHLQPPGRGAPGATAAALGAVLAIPFGKRGAGRAAAAGRQRCCFCPLIRAPQLPAGNCMMNVLRGSGHSVKYHAQIRDLDAGAGEQGWSSSPEAASAKRRRQYKSCVASSCADSQA